MLPPRFYSRIGKVAALVAATLILPVLAYAQNNQGGNNNNQGQNRAPVVPEVNPVWVLIPVAGAILFFSARRRKT